MTACSNYNIELVWQNPSRSTLRPLDVDFTYAAGKYDYLTCKFNSDTAQKIRDNIEVLDRTRAVEVKLDGKTIRTMYFDPENIMIGKDLRDSDFDGHLELHDLHEFFDSGEIDRDFTNKGVRTIYTELYRKRQGEKDPFPVDVPAFSTQRVPTASNQQPDEEDVEEAVSNNNYDYLAGNRRYYDDVLGKNIKSLDIKDNSTVLEAIKRANNSFSLNTRISPGGYFVVGGYQGTNQWIASETGGKSEYLIESAEVSQGYKKRLERVNINGPIEVLGAGNVSRTTGSVGSYLNPLDDAEDSGFQLRGIVEDPEVQDGKIVTKNMPEINPKDIDKIAQAGLRKFLEIDSQKQKGSVTIDVGNSGIQEVPDIGDTIFLPGKEGCGLLEGASYRADLFSIYSVRHKLKGDWQMELGIESIPTDPNSLQFRIGYIDNDSGKIYSYEDVAGYAPDPQSVAYAGKIEQEDIDEEF